MIPVPAHGLSAADIRREGWAVLTERLGVSGAIRFLLQYDPGRGDYTQEREALFADLTVDEAIRRMRKMRTAGQKQEARRRGS